MILAKKILVLGIFSVFASAVSGVVSAFVASKATETVNKNEAQSSQNSTNNGGGERDIEPGEVFA